MKTEEYSLDFKEYVGEIQVILVYDLKDVFDVENGLKKYAPGYTNYYDKVVNKRQYFFPLVPYKMFEK